MDSALEESCANIIILINKMLDLSNYCTKLSLSIRIRSFCSYKHEMRIIVSNCRVAALMNGEVRHVEKAARLDAMVKYVHLVQIYIETNFYKKPRNFVNSSK